MAITNEDLQYILEQVLAAIQANSQSVDELPTVNSLTGINSLPALQGQTVVKAPLSLLGQPATNAAATANAAADTATNAAAAANAAAANAESAIDSAGQAAEAADTAAEAANAAAANANAAAASAVRKITTKDKAGETITELTPDENGNVDLPMTGGGSGSGFFNVTLEIPLASGYYTKETAVAAMADAGIDDEDKPGMIITFEAEAGKWLDYRFEGTDIDTFTTPAAWNRYGGGDAIKQLTVQRGTEIEELTPNEAGNVELEIPVVDIDSTLIENSTNPVMGGAVAAAISELESQSGASLLLNTIGEGDDVAYSISLLDNENNVLSTTETFTGGGGSGSSLGTRVILTKVTANPTVKYGDTVNLQYLYDQIDTSTNDSTGNGATATLTVTYGATSTVREMDISAGSTNTINVTPFLGIGNNTVRIRIVTNDDAEQVSSISWTVKAVQLTLASSFNVATVIQRGNTVSIPYALSGSGEKTLRCYVDGVDVEDRTINTSSANGSFQINTSTKTHGSHSVQLVAELELTTGTIIMSNSIYFDIAVRETGNLAPVFATRFDFPDGTIIAAGQRPYIPAKQYDAYTLVYAAYNPSETPTQVNIYVDDALSSSASVRFVRTELSQFAMESGTAPARMECGSTQYTFNLNVNESELAITEPTDNMTLKLSAMGRTNSDVNRNEWTFNDIQTLFENFMWGGDGWIGDALRLKDDARATVQFQPLATPEQNATGAMSFTIRFKVTNIMDETAEIIRCMDGNGTGFVVTTQEARMVSRGNSIVTTKFASGETYNIGFVAYPKATTQSTTDEQLNDNMLYLYVNGIMSGGVQRGASDSIYQQTPQFIEMGSNECTLDVYSMRAYSVALTDSQILDAYMLDLGSSDALIEKYNENAVLDDNGQVSVDTVNLPYLIVTGQQENGVSTVVQAAVNNDKDPKYNVDEMLFVHPDDQTQNFRCAGGCIRLQGTSSMAYPTKNYRIYFKNAQGVAGSLYLGCDRQGVGGTLAAQAKYSLRPASANQKQAVPVNCFCLKADYAESSSSHNTGMTKLVHRVLEAAGEKTPAQNHVDASYAYDVRTCIDGYPCLLFYRNTVDEQPMFLGKYNFNNDKSTEEVFGFTGIPGYHNAEWVDVVFGGENPTECWEFLNNDYDMGCFLDDDFNALDEDGTPHWLKVFEARFPDDGERNAAFEAGAQPTYLKPLVQWVKSTDATAAGLTASQIAARKTKFRNELANWFDVPYLCDYYMFTEVFGCVDQRVKNMMMAFWYKPEADDVPADIGRMRAYMIFYDCDTILGLRNDGRLKYNWDLDNNTTDPELSSPDNTVYAYAGHNSVLWNNLRELFTTELAAAYARIRAAMSNDFIFNIFDTEQSSRFAERIYNLDALNKYVSPKTQGVDVVQDGQVSTLKYSYLEAMQGSRKAHRHWWLTNRLNLFDARYSAGQYRSVDLSFKGNSPAGATIRAVAARDFYFALARESTVLQHTAVEAGALWSFTYNYIANIGTIFHFYGGEYASSIDLSDWGGFTDLNIPRLPRLEELILGKSGSTYGLTEIAIGDKLPMLRELDIRNYNQLPSLDLSSCTRLEGVDAAGCTSLATILFAEGCPLESLHLPNGYQTLTLRSLPQITRAGITFDNRQSITGIWIENCPQLDGMALMNELLSLTGKQLHYVRITGVELEGDGSDLQALYDAGMGGLDAQGNTTSKCKLIGSYQLTQYPDEDTYNLLCARFDELTITKPPYTMIEFNDNVADDANVSNLDNGTGYKFGNAYVPSAHVLAIKNARHRVLGKQAVEGTMTIYPLHDKNSNYYADAANVSSASPASLNGSEGDVWMYEPAYWYKGINDILNGKKYSCFSTNVERPPVPDCTVLSYDDLVDTGNVALNNKLLPGYATISAATGTDSNYSVCKVNVAGRRKVRFPTAYASPTVCSSFTDDAGNIISDVYVPTVSAKFADGMYLIADVPQGATRLHFTILKTAEFDCVVLSDSERIEDMEPDWVEHRPCLCGVFEAASSGSLLRSVITGGVSYSDLTIGEFNLAVAARKLQLADYEMHKDVANLFFAFYGRRNAQAQCAPGRGSSSRIIGITAEIGMTDTANPNNASEYAWYPVVSNDGSVSYVQIDSVNCLGYENWYGNRYEWVGGLTIPNPSAAEYYKWNIVMPGGAVRKVKSGTVGGYITGVVHQKYMDVVPAFASPGNSSTYYCDEGYFSAATNRYAVRSSYTFQQAGGVTYIHAGYEASSKNGELCCRIAFRGQIVKAASVAEYKALTEIA